MPMKMLTNLSNQEATEFLQKYEHIIYLESRKRTRLPGIDFEDIEQICREKILTSLPSFDSNKSSEKTWVCKVIKNAIKSLWQQALRKKRMAFVDNSFKNDISFNENQHISFLSPSSTPEEYVIVCQALAYLKENMPNENKALISESLIEDLWKKIEPTTKNHKSKIKLKSKIRVDSIISGLEENEIKLLTQIADAFVRLIGFDREQILEREFTEDVMI